MLFKLDSYNYLKDSKLKKDEIYLKKPVLKATFNDEFTIFKSLYIEALILIKWKSIKR